ncbi:MAG: adenosylcobinamide-GDP ribazoletransferase [Desulfuromonadales bacterium]|nr:adenosylcobinamide-GDP ribazoletransferase [Desulfuromonadales bacterium]
MRLYIIAMQFLTIIPLPFNLEWRKDDLGRSLALFPLAGLTIGALLAGINWLIAPLLAKPLTDALLITALAAMTGALHMDGLADVFDGIAARGSRERFLAIMKDSNVGAIGAVGLVLGILLKWQALVAISAEHTWQALLFFPTLARYCQVQTIVGARRARQDGLGSAMIAGAGFGRLLVAAGVTLAIAWFLLEVNGVLVLAGAMLASWLIRAWFNRKLGGITGDVIGCINELVEILALILISALPKLVCPSL